MISRHGRLLPAAVAGVLAASIAVSDANSVTQSPGAAGAQLAYEAHLPFAANAAQLSDLPPAATAVPTLRRSPTPSATHEPSPSATYELSPSPTPPSADCARVPTFADGLEPEHYIHVAVDGSDAAGDGSASEPFATIGRAIREAVPGSAVAVHAGRYDGGVYIAGANGADGRPIWIGGAAGEERPVIEGGGEGIHLSTASYLVIHDLEVRGARNNGINCDDGGLYDNPSAAHHVLFRNLFVHDIGGDGNQDCLKLSGLNEFVVADSRFERCGGGYSGSGIDQVGCHDGLIARNLFSDHSANAIQAKGGSTDIEIRWNRIQGGGGRAINMGGSTGFEYFRPPLDGSAANAEARRISVYANLIVGAESPFAFVGCVDCVAQGNTIIHPETWLMRILQETKSSGGYSFEPSRRGWIVNNLFVFRRAQIRTYVNIGPGTDSHSFSFATNLWYAEDDPAQSQPELPSIETGGVVAIDPLLRPDYSIGLDSPAAHAGTAPAGAPGDITGACRSDPPSIGAFEASP